VATDASEMCRQRAWGNLPAAPGRCAKLRQASDRPCLRTRWL